MSIAGPLFLIGLFMFVASLNRALTGAVRFIVRQDWAMVGLGAAMMCVAVALWARGVT